MTADGDCFPVAFRLIRDNPTWRLCHGTVVRWSDGLHHSHAWVERDETVQVPLHDGSGTLPVSLSIAVDRANGNDVEMPVALYRKIGGAYNVAEYSQEDAFLFALRTGHYGPWS